MTTHPPTSAHKVTLRSLPDRDELLRASLGESGRARLLSQRCAEARAQDSPGQDVARVTYDPAARALSFCVADGVGSSYRGDIAASALATNLFGWLSALASPLPARDPARDALESRLSEWAAPAQAEMVALPIARGTPGLVREVLEELRDSYGGETVFLAGRLLLPESTTATAGGESAEALLCWMGNITLRYQSAGGSWTIPHSDDDSARWSTLRGPRGAVNVRRLSLALPLRLIVHSDGANALGPEIARLTDDDLRARAAALLATPTSDDVTILDLEWTQPTTTSDARKRDEP
ncbi:MAG: hypothetical protein ACRDHE_08110 [Ktedonobacterales bacterium]